MSQFQVLKHTVECGNGNNDEVEKVNDGQDVVNGVKLVINRHKQYQPLKAFT